MAHDVTSPVGCARPDLWGKREEAEGMAEITGGLVFLTGVGFDWEERELHKIKHISCVCNLIRSAWRLKNESYRLQIYCAS